MRNPNRIDKFCDEFAEIWKTQVPDWRFGQLIMNIFGQMYSEGRDPFFPEEDEMLERIKKYFSVTVGDVVENES